MSPLCKKIQNFEKNQIIVIKIIYDVGRRLVDKYREFHFCLFLIFHMCLYGDIKCMEIILVYKTNIKLCGFDSGYSDSQP